jgi:hypothetical protein
MSNAITFMLTNFPRALSSHKECKQGGIYYDVHLLGRVCHCMQRMWNTDYPNAELYSAHICFILPHRETEAKATFSAWITPPPRKEKVVGGGG